MLVTFVLTVLIDLTVAIQVGIILSSLLFIRRMAEVSQVNAITRDLREDHDSDKDGPARHEAIPKGVEVFEVYGTLFFGAVERFTESIRQVEEMPRVLILETSNLLAIDATGLHTLEDLATQLTQSGTAIIISGVHKQPLFAMEQAGLMTLIGEDNFCGTLDESLQRAAIITRP
jgi:SulP family sulfate permease